MFIQLLKWLLGPSLGMGIFGIDDAIIGGLIAGGGSLLGGLFGQDTEQGAQINLESLMPKWQSDTGKMLAEWIQKYMGQYIPGQSYSGKFSADMTGQEKTGLSLLDRFLSGENIGDLFKAGKQQISDTLAGKYADARSSPFIKAMQGLSKQDLADAINTSRRGAGARGKFFSTASLGEEGDLTSRSLNSMNSIIGSFIQNERQNMLNAVPMGNAMDQYELFNAPLSKISASQTFGSLSRTLEQADLERRYNDFLRQRQEMAMPIGAAGSLYGTNAQMGIPSWQMPNTQSTNSFGNIMNLLGGLNWGSLGGSGSIWEKLAGLLGQG